MKSWASDPTGKGDTAEPLKSGADAASELMGLARINAKIRFLRDIGDFQRVGALAEGLDARQCGADGECVDVFCTFVGEYSFQVHHTTTHVILAVNSIGT